MAAILAGSLAAAAGGLCGFLVGLARRRPRNEKYLGKAAVEAAGPALGAALLAAPVSAEHLALLFLAGLAWSQLCRLGRAGLTRTVENASASLRACLWSDTPPARYPPDVRRIAVSRPGVVWVKALHAIGWSDLSDEQVAAYETYRAQVARDIHHGEHLEIRRLWVRKRAWPLVGIALVGTAVNWACYRFAPAYAPLVQSLVILLLFLGIPDPLVDLRKRPDDTVAVRHFYRHCCALWASWVLLYLVLFGEKMCPLGAGVRFPVWLWAGHFPTWKVLEHFVDNANTFCSVMCYLVLRDPQVLSARTGPFVSRVFSGGAAALVVLTAAEVLCCLRWDASPYFAFVTGCAGGVGLLLLVGRLESQNLPAPFWLIVSLYFYGVIQGALALEDFADVSYIPESLYSLALALKCLLLLFMAWILESYWLFDYMKKVRELKEKQKIPSFPEDSAVADTEGTYP